MDRSEIIRDETTTGASTVEERRSDARIAVDLPVVLRAGERSCRGRTRDVSGGGVLVELQEPLSFIDRQVAVEVTMPDGTTLAVEADVVRRAVSTEGRLLIALKLVAGGGARALRRRAQAQPRADYSKRVHPSRAKPREPRSPLEARKELRALGVRALELALADPEARAPSSFLRWARGLADELGSTGPPHFTSNQGLVRSVARIHRESAPASG